MSWSEDYRPDGRPEGRRMALAAVPGDRKEVWVMGGATSTTGYKDDLWSYDLDSKTWAEYSWDTRFGSPHDDHYVSHTRMLWTGEEMWIYQGDSLARKQGDHHRLDQKSFNWGDENISLWLCGCLGQCPSRDVCPRRARRG